MYEVQPVGSAAGNWLTSELQQSSQLRVLCLSCKPGRKGPRGISARRICVLPGGCSLRPSGHRQSTPAASRGQCHGWCSRGGPPGLLRPAATFAVAYTAACCGLYCGLLRPLLWPAAAYTAPCCGLLRPCYQPRAANRVAYILDGINLHLQCNYLWTLGKDMSRWMAVRHEWTMRCLWWGSIGKG